MSANEEVLKLVQSLSEKEKTLLRTYDSIPELIDIETDNISIEEANKLKTYFISSNSSNCDMNLEYCDKVEWHGTYTDTKIKLYNLHLELINTYYKLKYYMERLTEKGKDCNILTVFIVENYIAETEKTLNSKRYYSNKKFYKKSYELEKSIRILLGMLHVKIQDIKLSNIEEYKKLDLGIKKIKNISTYKEYDINELSIKNYISGDNDIVSMPDNISNILKSDNKYVKYGSTKIDESVKNIMFVGFDLELTDKLNRISVGTVLVDKTIDLVIINNVSGIEVENIIIESNAELALGKELNTGMVEYYILSSGSNRKLLTQDIKAKIHDINYIADDRIIESGGLKYLIISKNEASYYNDIAKNDGINDFNLTGYSVNYAVSYDHILRSGASIKALGCESGYLYNVMIISGKIEGDEWVIPESIGYIINIGSFIANGGMKGVKRVKSIGYYFDNCCIAYYWSKVRKTNKKEYDFLSMELSEHTVLLDVKTIFTNPIYISNLNRLIAPSVITDDLDFIKSDENKLKLDTSSWQNDQLSSLLNINNKKNNFYDLNIPSVS